VYERLLPFLPLPGDEPAVEGGQGPSGVPDPTVLHRKPYAPLAREQAPTADRPTPVLPQPVLVPAELREDIRAARDQADRLIMEVRFSQAVDVLGEIIEPAARALGPENRAVLGLRRQRAAVRGGPASAGAAARADGRYASHQRLERLAVVEVGARNPDRDRQPGPFSDQVDLRAVLAAIHRIRACQVPFFRARMFTESIAHRDQSNSPREPSSSGTRR